MTTQISAFKVRVGDKVLDYRLGANLDLAEVRTFFSKDYKVKRLWNGGRHVLGVLEKLSLEYFFKLATTEGISVVTKNEYDWNNEFNKQFKRSKSHFWVPLNYDCGYYKNKLFYLVTDKFESNFLSSWPSIDSADNLSENIADIIVFSNTIQSLKLNKSAMKLLSKRQPELVSVSGKVLDPFDETQGKQVQNDKNGLGKENYKDWFVTKTISWLDSVSEHVVDKYDLEKLLKLVKTGAVNLDMKARHGDFAPWHLIKLNSGQLGLIDAEHAKFDAVELYDIGYLIQRVFSVLKAPELATKILNTLRKDNVDISKLKAILASRAIGGFLDESLAENPDYTFADKFKLWMLSL